MKHMRQNAMPTSPTAGDTIVKLPPSLEDVAAPYVDTLTLLRQKYEESVSMPNGDTPDDTSNGGRKIGLSDAAMEDQRKYQEAEEESYFFDEAEENNEVMNYNSDLRHNEIRQGYSL